MDHQTLLQTVKSEVLKLKATADHSAFWILDDWPTIDEGSAKSILPEITQIIHANDPGKPAICGFGAELGVNHTDNFNPDVMKNFSQAGCNIIALYIYSESVTNPNTSHDTFDWSMSTLLPSVFRALGNQGWDGSKVPFMGIAQAWAGARTDVKGVYEITPSAADIEQQSASFCKNGAQGINFYAWNDSTVSNIQTPATNTEIKKGVEQGIKACQTYWKASSSNLKYEPLSEHTVFNFLLSMAADYVRERRAYLVPFTSCWVLVSP